MSRRPTGNEYRTQVQLEGVNQKIPRREKFFLFLQSRYMSYCIFMHVTYSTTTTTTAWWWQQSGSIGVMLFDWSTTIKKKSKVEPHIIEGTCVWSLKLEWCVWVKMALSCTHLKNPTISQYFFSIFHSFLEEISFVFVGYIMKHSYSPENKKREPHILINRSDLTGAQ